MPTNAELQKQLEEQSHQMADLQAKLESAEQAAARPVPMSGTTLHTPLRFAFGRKVKPKDYWSNTPNIHVTKSYMDPITQKAASDFDEIQFHGHWYTTANELEQQCLESQEEFRQGAIVVVTEKNRSIYVSREAAKRKQTTYIGPATTAEAKAELSDERVPATD